MKVGPKVPGPGDLPQVEGPGAGEAAGGAGRTAGARGFAEALDAVRRPEAAGAPEAAIAGSVADIVARFGAGELSRPEAVRQVAEAAVGSWPEGLADEAMRARAIEDMAAHLAVDPTFGALLDAASGGGG